MDVRALRALRAADGERPLEDNDSEHGSDGKRLSEVSDSEERSSSDGKRPCMMDERGTEAKPTHEESHSDQDCDATTSPVRRGVRTSYFRSRGTPKSLSLHDDNTPVHSPTSRTCGEREPLEILLSASEEGDLAGVHESLERPDAAILVNLSGHARNIVRQFDVESGRPSEWGHPESLTCYRGDTALGYAAFHGYVAVVQALLAAGSVPGLRNDECKSALALAEVRSRVRGVCESASEPPQTPLACDSRASVGASRCLDACCVHSSVQIC